MKQFYLLIDIDSGNVASDYETKEQALDALRALYDGEGSDAIQNYLLMEVDGAGEQTFIAAQDDLIHLALSTEVVRR